MLIAGRPAARPRFRPGGGGLGLGLGEAVWGLLALGPRSLLPFPLPFPLPLPCRSLRLAVLRSVGGEGCGRGGVWRGVMQLRQGVGKCVVTDMWQGEYVDAGACAYCNMLYSKASWHGQSGKAAGCLGAQNR
jgi:hypothetical protein